MFTLPVKLFFCHFQLLRYDTDAYTAEKGYANPDQGFIQGKDLGYPPQEFSQLK